MQNRHLDADQQALRSSLVGAGAGSVEPAIVAVLAVCSELSAVCPSTLKQCREAAGLRCPRSASVDRGNGQEHVALQAAFREITEVSLVEETSRGLAKSASALGLPPDPSLTGAQSFPRTLPFRGRWPSLGRPTGPSNLLHTPPKIAARHFAETGCERTRSIEVRQ
ncbi:hypothetical protein L1887_54079 [Cichorium endivia]|nr:hypothetical protein L1887_54079 [Cichorium endivia]